MKIYAIIGDNGERFDDSWWGIMEEHIYSNPRDAEEACFKLNHPIIVQPTNQDWIECGWECTWEEFVEYYMKSQKTNWTYTVKELELK